MTIVRRKAATVMVAYDNRGKLIIAAEIKPGRQRWTPRRMKKCWRRCFDGIARISRHTMYETRPVI